VVRALVAEPSCAEVVMVNRKAIPLTANHRLRQVILDTASAQFPTEVTKLALSMVALGDPVYGASCVGVGKGSMKWSEEELKALEVGVVGGFARGCHAGGVAQFALLSAAGSTAKSRIRYVRVMGLKEETVQGIGFKSLAIFRPGIIAGNAHTPGYAAWLGRLIPGPFGTIEQDDIGRAFAAEFINSSALNGVVYLENAAMKQRSRGLTYVLFPGASHRSGCWLKETRLRAIQLCSISAAARLPTFLSAASRPRSSSGLSSENTLFICPECFRKAVAMRSLPRAERATIRTRRSWVLSSRLTRPFAKRRSTAILIEPGVRSTIGPIVLTGKGPLCSRTSSTPKSERPSPVSSMPAAAYLVRARIAFIITSQTWSVP